MLSSSLTLQKAMQSKIYQLGHLLPVWPSSKLLAAVRHQTLLQEIQQLSALPEAHFKALYRVAINRFAEMVQVIPEASQGGLGGLLNLGLARAILALRQFTAEAAKVEADPLVNYAIFTAGLFFDTAKIISQQKIVVCGEDGQYKHDWLPYAGSMVEQGVDYYKMYPYSSTVYEALNHETAAMFARQLMPQEGFLWLSSDLDLFIDWLGALRGEQGQTGRKITRALSLIRLEDILGLLKNLPQAFIDTIVPKETSLEDSCFIWLREGLANGAITINTADASVHVLEDGTIYLHNDVFKRFISEHRLKGELGSSLADLFNHRFGLESLMITQGKAAAYANFLKRPGGDQRQVVRQGMVMDKIFLNPLVNKVDNIPKSSLEEAIKDVFQPKNHHYLPSVAQSIPAERPQQSPSPTSRFIK
jgi:DNA relaxase TraI-like protein